MFCCGVEWAGADRAHCCRRTGGCGHVFDDAGLWDQHRRNGRCLDPRSIDLVLTTNGLWLRTLESEAASESPRRRARPARSRVKS